MLDKAQQPTSSPRRATGRQAHGGKRGRTLPLPAFLALPIALLALAAPASAAGPVTGVLNTVAKAATPAVTQAASAAATVAPAPAAAQRAGDVAPVPAPVDRTVSPTTSLPTTSSVSTVESELPAAASHRDQTTPAGAPAHQPESAPSPGEAPHAPGSTPSRAISSGDNATAATSTASPQGPSDPVARVVQGVALTAKQVTAGASHPTGLLPAGRDERRVLPSRALDAATAGTAAHAVRQLVLAPGLLGASRALGDVGGTATRLVETTPATIAPLLRPLARTLTLPSLPEPAVLPELSSLPTLPLLPTLPSLLTLPAFPTLPSLLTPPALPEQSPIPVFTATPRPPSAAGQPIALSLPAGAVSGGSAGPSTATAPQVAWQGSSAVQAYAATANGIGGAIGAPDRLGSDRPGTTNSAVGALRSAAAWLAGTTTTSAYGLRTSDRTAPAPITPSLRDAQQQPSPAPSPGGASPATGAVAGTSIPIFLTLAGLLLLAAPRVRRVLRLLGESWRLSPLALIPERPG
jgi:hypothetical protein